jgi:hypothetical protein
MKIAQELNDLFLKLISATRGAGPSSTRFVYLINGMAAVFCALFATIGGTLYYCKTGNASTVYWGGVSAMWTATLGFGALTKKEQNKTTKEIALARGHELAHAAASGD